MPGINAKKAPFEQGSHALLFYFGASSSMMRDVDSPSAKNVMRHEEANRGSSI
jgi:hypothetical protein